MSLDVQHLNPAGLRRNPAFTNVVTVSGAAKRVIIGAIDPVDEHGALVGAGDLVAQTEQILRNLEVSLAAAGAKLDDVVIWRIFVEVGQNVVPAAQAAMRVWGSRPNPPANTVVFVAGVGYPGALVTLEAEAVVPA
jgi:enamine deaminase RidA (YjgF/YER057c/UK114 family)